MDQLLSHIAMRSGAQDASLGQPRLGIVANVDPARQRVRVMLMPESVLTGYLACATVWTGAGWGLSSPPTSGDQVIVLPIEGSLQSGIVIGRVWSDTQTAPNTPSGELWLTHKSGSTLRLTNDGNIVSTAPTWTHTGDFVCTGNVSDAHGTLEVFRNVFNEHVHGNSAGPTPMVPA